MYNQSQSRRRSNPYQSSRRQQRAPGSNNNSNSNTNRYLAVSALFGFLGLWYLTPVSDWITNAVLVFVPIEADIDLGREAWRSMDYRSVQDRWGVHRIGHELVSKLSQDLNSANEEMPWSFGVIHADFVNAFALPGGIVRVTDALLEQLQLSDAELAALIGHEMGHVLHRHSQARVLKEKLITYLLQAVFYEDNDGYEETFGEAVGELLLKSATFLGKQSFSRKNEYEADATAWQLLGTSRHYSPQAVESLLQKLWRSSGRSCLLESEDDSRRCKCSSL
jgi:Zn-dependent protease with chaperone function